MFSIINSICRYLHVSLSILTDLHIMHYSESLGQSPSLQDLLHLKVHQQISTKYKDFGTFLLNDDTGYLVNNIERKCQQTPDEINTKILEEWLAGGGRPCTWETLIEVLRECKLNALADQIQDAMKL